jgi:hypothetical protein
MRLFAVLPLLVSFIAPTPAAADAARDVKKVVDPTRHAQVLRVQPNDPLTRHNLAKLAERSATARDVIERLQQFDDAVLIIRAHPMLVRETQAIGRGKLWVVNGRLYGVFEYQAEPRGSLRPLRVLAQQLGHALEVALAPRGQDTRTLRKVLVTREDLDEPMFATASVETEFARLIGRRVATELSGKTASGDGLAEAAGAARLELPPLAARRIATPELPR